MGLEPTNGGTTNLCLNHLATIAIQLNTIAQSAHEQQLEFCKPGAALTLNPSPNFGRGTLKLLGRQAETLRSTDSDTLV
jgi:hypothetical protein